MKTLLIKNFIFPRYVSILQNSLLLDNERQNSTLLKYRGGDKMYT